MHGKKTWQIGGANRMTAGMKDAYKYILCVSFEPRLFAMKIDWMDGFF